MLNQGDVIVDVLAAVCIELQQGLSVNIPASRDYTSLICRGLGGAIPSILALPPVAHSRYTAINAAVQSSLAARSLPESKSS